MKTIYMNHTLEMLMAKSIEIPIEDNQEVRKEDNYILITKKIK